MSAAETDNHTFDNDTNGEAITSEAAPQEVSTDLPPAAAAAAVMPEQEMHQEQEAPSSTSSTMGNRERKPRKRPVDQDQTATLQREALETAKRPSCDSDSFQDDAVATRNDPTNSFVDRENQHLDTLLLQHTSARAAFATAPTSSSEQQESDTVASDNKHEMMNATKNPRPAPTKGGEISVSQTHRRPGAQMVPGRALGIRPSYMERIQQRQQLATETNTLNQGHLPPTEEVLLEATLVSESTPPNYEMASNDIESAGTRSGKTYSSTNAPMMDTTTNTSTHSIIPIEVEPTVITNASRVNPKRIYTMIGLVVLVLAGALATVLGVLLTNRGHESESPHIPELTEVLARVPETICYEWTPGEGRSDECSVSESAKQGGGVGNLVTVAFLDRHPSVDIVIQNAGAIRADIVAGNFTGLDAHLVLPFKNLLYSVEMTGSQIHLALEQGLDYVFSDPTGDNHTGAYPYAAGLRFAVDMSQDMGNRVHNLLVRDRDLGTWSDIEVDQRYTVLANNFLMSGGDNYTVFESLTESTLLAEDATVVFILFAQDKGVLVAPELDEYSTMSYIPP